MDFFLSALFCVKPQHLLWLSTVNGSGANAFLLPKNCALSSDCNHVRELVGNCSCYLYMSVHSFLLIVEVVSSPEDNVPS